MSDNGDDDNLSESELIGMAEAETEFNDHGTRNGGISGNEPEAYDAFQRDGNLQGSEDMEVDDNDMIDEGFGGGHDGSAVEDIDSGFGIHHTLGIVPRQDDEVIFGTDISLMGTINEFKAFLLEFQVDFMDGDEVTNRRYFVEMLRQIYQKSLEGRANPNEEGDDGINVLHLVLDAHLLLSHNEVSTSLYHKLVAYPQELIPAFEFAVNQVFKDVNGLLDDDENPEQDARGIPQVLFRVMNLKDKKSMRELDPEDVDSLVSVCGMVIRSGDIIPEMKQGCFQCTRCKNLVNVTLRRNRITEPKSCMLCGEKDFRLKHQQSLFVDKQSVKLQERVEEMNEGETPQSVLLNCFDDLVNCVKPGDRIEVTGILRVKGLRVNPRQRVLKAIFRKYVDVVHIRVLAVAQNKQLGTGVELSKETLFRMMAQDPNLYEDLARSIAPSLFGLDEIKKGILCLLFGGSNSANDNLDEGVKPKGPKKTRGELNILLCGDPGTAKSQLLSFIHQVSPRGIYTSGKGSSAVGLTAYVARDEDTGESVLESGALVLSDLGICCIDEFDKMSEATRSILHECMEQQTISIAKAGIITSLNARTSILASANPIDSKYNAKLSLIHNINLPPTIISRFDLIYLVLDKVEENHDRSLAKHIVNLFSNGSDEDDTDSRIDGGSTVGQVQPIHITFENYATMFSVFPHRRKQYSVDILKEYVAFVKRIIRPQITVEAKEELVEQYVSMREKGNAYGSNHVGRKTISATTRQLESLIRISESLAKMNLVQDVTRDHVKEAVRLMHEATHKSAIDPRTGIIDLDALNTGIGDVDRRQVELLADQVLKILQQHESNIENETTDNRSRTRIKVFDIAQQLNEDGGSMKPSQIEVRHAIEHLKSAGKVDYNKVVGTVSLSSENNY